MRGIEILSLPEQSKVLNYVSKKSKKWFNIDAKIQKNCYGEYLLHIKYTSNPGTIDNRNWIHNHRIVISKIK